MLKVFKILLLICLSSFLLVGCEEPVTFDKPELMLKLINNTVELTEKAVTEKNLKLARDLWGQISEVGLKAKESGNNDLVGSLEKMACSYACLVEYLRTDEQQKLEDFNASFREAVDELKLNITSKG